MPKPYSLDLRERVVGFVEDGHSCRAAAAHFKVSVSFVVNLMKAVRTRGSVAPKSGDPVWRFDGQQQVLYYRRTMDLMAPSTLRASTNASADRSHTLRDALPKKPGTIRHSSTGIVPATNTATNATTLVNDPISCE
jgi:hypothetical protein